MVKRKNTLPQGGQPPPNQPTQQSTAGPSGQQPPPQPPRQQPPPVPPRQQPTPGPSGFQPSPGPSGFQPSPGPSGFFQPTPGHSRYQLTPGPSRYQPTPGPSGIQPTPGPSGIQPTPGPSGIQPTPGPSGYQPIPPPPRPAPQNPTSIQQAHPIMANILNQPVMVRDDNNNILFITHFMEIVLSFTPTILKKPEGENSPIEFKHPELNEIIDKLINEAPSPPPVPGTSDLMEYLTLSKQGKKRRLEEFGYPPKKKPSLPVKEVKPKVDFKPNILPYSPLNQKQQQALNINTKPGQVILGEFRRYEDYLKKYLETEMNMEIDSEDEDFDQMPEGEELLPGPHVLPGQSISQKKVWHLTKDSRPNQINTRQFLFKSDQLDHISVSSIDTLLKANIENEWGVNVTHVEKTPLLPVGENYNSILCNVIVKYTVNKPKSTSILVQLLTDKTIYQRVLVAKVLPDGLFHIKNVKDRVPIISDQFRPNAKELLMHFDRERRFYEQVWPHMAKLSRVYKKYQHPEHIVPKFYKKSPRYCLYFENLESEYYRLHRCESLDLDHCKVAFRTLAHLHAASIAVSEKNINVKDQFPSLIASMMDVNKLPYYLYTNLIRCLSTEVRNWKNLKKTLPSSLLGYSQKVFDEITKMRSSKFGHLKVFLHGDFWSGNIMFRKCTRKNEKGKDEEYLADLGRLLDFQCCQWGTPAIDLLNFLFISAKREVLFQDRDELFTFYYKEMETLLKNKYSLNPDVVFPKRKLKEDLDQCYFYGILTGLTMRWVTQTPFNEQPDFNCLLIEEKSPIDNKYAYWRNILNTNSELKETIQKMLTEVKAVDYLRAF